MWIDSYEIFQSQTTKRVVKDIQGQLSLSGQKYHTVLSTVIDSV